MPMEAEKSKLNFTALICAEGSQNHSFFRRKAKYVDIIHDMVKQRCSVSCAVMGHRDKLTFHLRSSLQQAVFVL